MISAASSGSLARKRSNNPIPKGFANCNIKKEKLNIMSITVEYGNMFNAPRLKNVWYGFAKGFFVNSNANGMNRFVRKSYANNAPAAIFRRSIMINTLFVNISVSFLFSASLFKLSPLLFILALSKKKFILTYL